jgi:Bacterial membrane protein YfhO
VKNDFKALAVLAGLTLLFFFPLVLHPTQVLYSDRSDFLAFHLPSKWFLVRSFQDTGELPLWCPESYAGMPYIHDPQVSIFYPLHWPLLIVPVDRVGAVLSWLVVLHVLIAGFAMFAYARSRNLGTTAAVVAALGWMFAGKWLIHVLTAGHYNMIPLAWLPLVLLGLEGAIRRASVLHAVLATVAFALIVLAAYPYMTFYAGLFVALWSLGPALELSGRLGAARVTTLPRALGRWLVCGAGVALLAAALSAVQLLPSAEAAALSTRVGFQATVAKTLAGGAGSALALIGPPLSGGTEWELRAGFGLLWLIAAVWGAILGGKRARFDLAVGLFLFFFALGGAVLFQNLPGFRLFRYPARMFMVAALPVSLLAGTATQALLAGPELNPTARRRCRNAVIVLAGFLVLITATNAMFLGLENKPIRFSPYWLVSLLAVPVALWIIHSVNGVGQPRRILPWAGLLLAELWFLTWPQVETRPEIAIYPDSPLLETLFSRRNDYGRVLDVYAPYTSANEKDLDPKDTPLGLGAPLAQRYELQPLRGFNPIDVRRYKEYLQFVFSDKDAEMTALENPYSHPVLLSFPIRNRSLLDLLGTRYVLHATDDALPRDDWKPLKVDERPAAFNFNAGGVRTLPQYTLEENTAVFPRAFVVPQAEALPERPRVLNTLKTADFREKVYLEDLGSNEPHGASGSFRPATIRLYYPNRIEIDVEGTEPGHLVLTDVWFPGWECTVDGKPETVKRADFLFRSVPVEAGNHKVVFTFVPQSYRLGKIVSLTALIVLLGLTVVGWVRSSRAGAPAIPPVPATPPRLRASPR